MFDNTSLHIIQHDTQEQSWGARSGGHYMVNHLNNRQGTKKSLSTFVGTQMDNCSTVADNVSSDREVKQVTARTGSDGRRQV